MAQTKQKQGSSGAKYATYEDVRRALLVQTEAGLIEALTFLRNQLTIKHTEDSVSPNDERLLLAKAWLEADEGAHTLFDLWGQANTRQAHILSLILSVLSCLVTLLSTHYPYHHLATPIIRSLLSPQWSSKLNTYLSATQILATLKLYNSLSSFGGGKECRAVLDAFPWELKTLPKLLNMRRRAKGQETIDTLVKPDIRTLYVLFLLSFVDSKTPTVAKVAFLEQRREQFASIFRGLQFDSYSVLRRVFETCWVGVWSDVKVKRTAKISVFSEAVVGHMIKLYGRNMPEGDDEEIPADVVHHFLLAICTRPGTGICFKDQGWYPREDGTEQEAEADERSNHRPQGRIYNKILANILKTLRVNEDARQQELALRILQACPELVAGYWPAAALTLEPRLSSKWIANIAFFGSAISLPVPLSSFALPENPNLYRPNPPALSSIMENILPAVNIKIHLSRGLQSSSALVQHCTALALSKCLAKFGEVQKHFRKVQEALEEDPEDGLWSSRLREVEKEVAKRVPDFQVIVAFAHQKGGNAPADPKAVQQIPNAIKIALLSESAQRLLWLYHQYLPQLVAEARFDVTKLLLSVQDSKEDDDAPRGLTILRQLHTLRLLNENEEFSLSGKTGSSRGNLNILLTLYTQSHTPAIKSTIAALLQRSLSLTLLFQHDPDEVDLWLRCLPRTKRSAGAQAPDGVPLTDEPEGVITFLDDCVQRCLKAPYRYLEDLQKSWVTQTPETSHSNDADELPSPLLITVIEQLGAKVERDLLSQSDCLAIVTFIRKLFLQLASKTAALDALVALGQRVETIVSKPAQSSVLSAIRRESQALLIGLEQLRHPRLSDVPMDDVDPVVQDFLNQVEEVDTPESTLDQQVAAYELVDWLRLANPSLASDQLWRLASNIHRLYAPATTELLEHTSLSLSGPHKDEEAAHHIITSATFPSLFAQYPEEALQNAEVQIVLVDSLFRSRPTPSHVKQALRLLDHRLIGSSDGAAEKELFSLAATILGRLNSESRDRQDTILLYFWGLPGVTACSRRSCHATAISALSRLVAISAEMTHCDNLTILEHASFWETLLKQRLEELDDSQISTSVVWLQYMSTNSLVDLLDHLHQDLDATRQNTLYIIEAVLAQLIKQSSHEAHTAIAQRLPQIQALQTLQPDSSSVQRALSIATQSTLPLYHDGQCPSSIIGTTLSTVVARAQSQWRLYKKRRHTTLEVVPLLQRTILSDQMSATVAAAVYSDDDTALAVQRYLFSEDTSSWSIHALATVLSAALDTATIRDNLSLDADNLIVLCKRIYVALMKEDLVEDSRTLCASSLSHVSKLPHAVAQRVLKALWDEHRSMRINAPANYLLKMVASLTDDLDTAALRTVEDILEHSLKWITTVLSSNHPRASDAYAPVLAISRVFRRYKTINAHLAETTVSAALQHCLRDVVIMSFVSDVVQCVQFKPVTVNKFLQTILQHQLFCTIEPTAETSRRDSQDKIIDVLHALFHRHPANTCQASHIIPLVPLYGGTLSSSDRKLQSIFQLFELSKKSSIASLIDHWSSSPDVTSSSALQSIQSLDSSWVFRTCLHFPLGNDTSEEGSSHTNLGAQMYDPQFVLLLVARMLETEVPTSALSWVQMLRTNVVSLLIRELSAHDHDLRDGAMIQLSRLHHHLQNADLQEKPHVLHILNLLRDTYSLSPATPHSRRLPAYITLHLAHALRGVFYPSNFTYPLTARFLLQRPELDTEDLPLLYSMLYSTSEQWRKERAWIVRFLADGMIGRQEWRVLRRRHTWDLLASIFQSNESDQTLRRSIMELLANLTCQRHATTSLVLGSALLAWIELQLHPVVAEEGEAWVKIVENILISADLDKLEAGSSGEWRSVVLRCLHALMESSGCRRLMVAHIVRITFRLSLVSAVTYRQLDGLIHACVKYLSTWEAAMQVAIPQQHSATSGDSIQLPLPPHRSPFLWDTPELESIPLWGTCVELLWSAAMRRKEKCSDWESLNHRMLIWRAIAGEMGAAPEWTRKEVVRIMGST